MRMRCDSKGMNANVVRLAALGAIGAGAIAGVNAYMPKPAAASADYAFMCATPAGSPCHWDSSKTVTVSGTGLDTAVSQVAQATGLTMKIIAGPADINVTVESPLNGERAGEASVHHSDAGIIDGASIVVSPRTPANLLHETLIHELGHAVGLDHAAGTDQVMSPVLTGANDYQAGDLAGLRLLG
jgi:hypothetical protein